MDNNGNVRAEKRDAIICFALVFLGAIIYISLTFNRNVWLDEAFTASLVDTDYAGVLSRSMNDTLPPLYNLILKASTDIFGYRVPVMKMTSALFIVLTMLLSATVVRKRHGVITASLFIIALIVMPNMMFFGVEIRMYSLGFFMATASGIYAFEVVENSTGKNWILFTVFSVLAGYSHHFAFVTVGFVYLFLLIYYLAADRKNIKRWLICLLFTFLLYLPCFVVTLRQLKSVSGYFSMPEVTPSVFVKYMRYPYTVGFTPLTILLAALVIVLVVSTILRIVKDRNLRDIYALSMFAVYYGVLLFGSAVSKVMTANIFVDRYLFFAHGLLWLFAAVEVPVLYRELRNKDKKTAAAVIISAFAVEILIGSVSYSNALKSEYAGDADKLIAYLDENVKDGDVLYTVEDAESLSLSLPFYDKKLVNYESLEEASKEAESNHSTLWCAVLDGYDTSDADYGNYRLDYAGDFAFDRYTFKLYKMVR